MARIVKFLEDAEIIFRNFRGEGSKFNRDGSRNFCVILSEDDAEMFADMGCNIKRTKPKKEGDVARPYVKVLLGDYDPEIYVITNGRKKLLTPSRYGKLDRLNFETVDMEVVRGNKQWETNGQTGYSLYLESMVAILPDSRLRSKYADYDEDEEELPFD